MSQKNREPGFYWVRGGGTWVVAQWSGYSWWVTTTDCLTYDNDWDEIDERRITREEPKS